MQIIFSKFRTNLTPTLVRLIIAILLFGTLLAQVPVLNVRAAGEPQLLLTKTIDNDITNAKIGDTIFYRIRFQCSSLTTDCGDVEITDVLPTNPSTGDPLFTFLPAD
jgi:uncharacterized repeat protein (TIGR01451 family)